jgi:pimeloyl-ACP methyl ester carboxylesterase
VVCLEQAGYLVVAPSLPGFGESDRPQDVAAYSLESLARCLLGLLDHLKITKVRSSHYLL